LAEIFLLLYLPTQKLNFLNQIDMKRVTILVLFMYIGITAISAQSTKTKIDPEGTWKFEAPYAAEGYTSGTIVFGKSEQKPTATISFTGSDYKLSGANVLVENDAVTFSVSLESQDIKVSLKIENATKMTGKAVYSEGDVPLTLTKSIEQDKK
jgi:hypothetical protein